MSGATRTDEASVALDALPDGVARITSSGHVSYANPIAQRMLDTGLLLGDLFLDGVPGPRDVAELAYRSPGGAVHTVEARCLQDGASYLVILREINALGNGSSGAPSMDWRFAAAFAAAPMLMASWDMQGHVIDIQGGVLGIEADAMGPAAAESKVFATFPGLRALMKRALAGASHKDRWRNKGRILDLTISPAFGADGRPAGAHAMLVDVTDSAFEESARMESQARGWQASVVNAAVHEFATPLTPAILALHMLHLEAEELSPIGQRALQHLDSSIQRIQHVLHGFVQARQGPRLDMRTPTSVEELLARTVGTLTMPIQVTGKVARRISVDVDVTRQVIATALDHLIDTMPERRFCIDVGDRDGMTAMTLRPEDAEAAAENRTWHPWIPMPLLHLHELTQKQGGKATIRWDHMGAPVVELQFPTVP